MRCNDADEKGHGRKSEAKGSEGKRERSRKAEPRNGTEKPKKRRGASKDTFTDDNSGDWRQFFKGNDVKFKDDEPDFSEEGWAMRKPRKK